MYLPCDPTSSPHSMPFVEGAELYAAIAGNTCYKIQRQDKGQKPGSAQPMTWYIKKPSSFCFKTKKS